MTILETIAAHPYLLGSLLPVLYYVLPYIRNKSLITIPGPPLAVFSNLWLLYKCRMGRRYNAVDEAHKKYGTMVRIQPNHVSIADADMIPVIYGHGNGFLKAEYYDAFVSIRRGLFNTRDRAEHTRKRKTIAHTFSAKSIGQFEQYMHSNLEEFVKQWDYLSAGKDSSGYAHIDSLHWFNYLAFDIIGDLAFGAPFGMLKEGKDVAAVQRSPDAPITYAPAIQVLNRRGEVSGTLGCLPQLKPYAKYLPDRFFRDGLEAVENLAGIATARVSERLKPEVMEKNTRVDLLARLMEGKDEKGQKLGREELTAEALTQLIAGSDTTSNTACAIMYWVLRTPGVPEKLQKELDAAIPEDVEIPDFSMVKDLPYLHHVMNETMRIHSTSSLGLPRIVPSGTPTSTKSDSGSSSHPLTPSGVTIHGHTFAPGTTLSVPSYTIHHSRSIWGADADEFNPDRWDDDRLTDRQRNAFIPFSHGPRACVGRNVAEMELALIMGTVFRRYECRLEQGVDEWETREGFLRKPLGLKIGMRRRM